MEWVIEGLLARAERPGYPWDRVSKEEVDRWIQEASCMGIKSIICLLKDELRYYRGIGGLLRYYRRNGFNVYNYAVSDYQLPPVPHGLLRKIGAEFDIMEKPVLVHCSAGVDRTGSVIDYLLLLDI